jgi:hypothetical protein
MTDGAGTDAPGNGSGLCAGCVHARVVTSGKGSSFWLCGRSATDARFARYPRLPVEQCAGFAPAPDQGAQR